jgi:AraC-like DNA-binding protein
MSRGLELLRRALTILPESQTEPARDAHPISERIRLYVLENLENDLSLPQIEMDLGMNRRSIQRHFKNGTGSTLSDFIRHQRLTRARRALSEDGMSISQAAYLAGYSSPENFSVAFQHAFGLAPQRLRNGSI